MSEWVAAIVAAGTAFGQFIFAAVAIYALLQLLPKRPVRWERFAFLSWRTVAAPEAWLRTFAIRREHPSFQERELLLAGCGVSADPAWYMLFRKIAITLSMMLSLLVVAVYKHTMLTISTQLLAGLLLLAIGLTLDRVWLQAVQKLRSLKLTKEIYIISNQLLYLSGSTLNIHTKLMRCVPYTRVMRSDLERLLAEWYHDPALALRAFKLRIGTDEGMSFVETIDVIRQHESDQYYELLRVRISDYKEKLELAKESRKESTSYVLFVVAGIPILYTFQVFIYPWVKEGQKLFQSLG